MCLHGYAQETNEEPLIKATSKKGSCCTSGSCCNGNMTPAGIMTDHIHAKGEWMVSWSYMDMEMKGNRTGTAKTSDSAMYAKGYMMAPTTMSMRMHMAMVMYGLTDKLTLMGMGGYVSYDMKMAMPGMMIMPGMTDPSSTMGMTSSGLTDTRLSALYNIPQKNERTRLIASVGVNIPTGSIEAKGPTVLGANERLPYNMQPGTGSWSVQPDLTYVLQAGKWNVGVNAGGDIKLNFNSLGYRQGDQGHGTVWAAHDVFKFMSASVRGEYVHTYRIAGSDSVLAIPVYEQLDPTTSTRHYGGEWLNAYVGLNFHTNVRILEKFQLQAEYGLPVYEKLNGPQMSVHSSLAATLQYRF
jgi:hypothetical protein